MKKTIRWQETDVEVFWNEKTYNGLRYITTSHGYQSARGTWDANLKQWKKLPGGLPYSQFIARELGWLVG